MKTMNLIQEVYFNMLPIELYKLITDSTLHTSITKTEANISDLPNTDFTLFGGYINGTNILLEPGKVIIQEWQAKEEEWPEYHYSTVQYKMTELDGGTHLTFIHKGIPEPCFENISNGWNEYYWEPIKKYLNQLPS